MTKYKIYKVTSWETEMTYIGVTHLTLDQALKQLMQLFNYWSKGSKVYFLIVYAMLPYADVKLELLEEIETDKYEMVREKVIKYINQYSDTCLNYRNFDYWKPSRPRNEEKFTCECGKDICLSMKARHLKSGKHQLYLKQKTQYDDL